MIEKVLDYIFPNFTCLCCGDELRSKDSFCKKCLSKFKSNADLITLVSKNGKQYFDRADAPFVYEAPISDLIMELKYSDNGMAAKAIAPYMAELITHPPDVLIPVPLCKKRQKERGYNQAELLARAIGEIIHVPVRTDILTRVKATAPQKHMSVCEREANLKGAFCVSPLEAGEAYGSSIMLVDDVFTSGSTVNECARVLKKAGVRKVDVVVIAVVRPH